MGRAMVNEVIGVSTGGRQSAVSIQGLNEHLGVPAMFDHETVLVSVSLPIFRIWECDNSSAKMAVSTAESTAMERSHSMLNRALNLHR